MISEPAIELIAAALRNLSAREDRVDEVSDSRRKASGTGPESKPATRIVQPVGP